MYGENTLTGKFILKYGLTREFHQTFRLLNYSGISLPLAMTAPFQQFIKTYIEKNNTVPLEELKNKYDIHSVCDAQRKLFMVPQRKKDLSRQSGRKGIMMPGSLLPLAIKRFRKYPVVLIVTSSADKRKLNQHRLPPNFDIIDLTTLLKKNNSNHVKKTYEDKIKKVISRRRNHRVFGTSAFQNKITKWTSMAIKYTKVLEKIILDRNIKMILSIDLISMPWMLLAQLSHKYKLSYIWIQNWLLTDHSVTPSLADHHCVWGENYKQWLINKGIDENKISVVGSIRFELESPTTRMTRKELCQKLNIPEKNTLITFTTQGTFTSMLFPKIMPWFNKVLREFPVTIIIKSRTRDFSLYKKYERHPQVVLSPLPIHLYDTLKNTDYLMTISSTTSIEAASFNKGIIVLQPDLSIHFGKGYQGYHNHLARADAGPVIRNATDFYNVVKHLHKDKNAKEAIVKQSQSFLKNSLDRTQLPSIQISRIVHKYLGDHSL